MYVRLLSRYCDGWLAGRSHEVSEWFRRTFISALAVQSSLMSDFKVRVLLRCAGTSNLRSSTAWNRSLPTLAS